MNLVQLSAHVSPVLQQVQTGGKELVDYAFWKGILLVVTALLVAFSYRFLSLRMNHSKAKSL